MRVNLTIAYNRQKEVKENTTQNVSETPISESAKQAIDSANAAWKDSSQYITISIGEESTLRFHPDMKDGITYNKIHSKVNRQVTRRSTRS